ncbi:response regulator [Sphingomonas sp. PB2P19]|uniref:response regulator transcription factor n=1 Tax=Sphingomonas rhamnosi TaxID=3096156 RepID=UPI002FC6FC19
MSLILIADDDELVAALVQYKLEAAGHRVVVTEDGPAALDAATREPPDLVLLDAMMPGLTGFEVLARLRAAPATAIVPIIMLTARRSQDDIDAARRGGATDYLTKPFVPDDLLARVESALAQSRPPALPDAAL